MDPPSSETTARQVFTHSSLTDKRPLEEAKPQRSLLLLKPLVSHTGLGSQRPGQVPRAFAADRHNRFASALFCQPLTVPRSVDENRILMLMISTINRIYVQGTSCLAVLSGVASAKTEAFSEGGSPHKFTPVPGVHKEFEPIPLGRTAHLRIGYT